VFDALPGFVGNKQGILVGLGGVEPPTCGLGNCQSEIQQRTFNNLALRLTATI